MPGPSQNLDCTIVRPESGNDWLRIDEICCLNGNANRSQAFSKKWIEPYRTHFSEWAYIAKNDDQVVGYLTGCPRSENLSKDFFETEFRSLNLFSKESIEKVMADYPAHLHVNFEAQFRGLGLGSRLIKNFCNDLRKQGVPGVHVMCGPDPVRFYTNNGFETAEQVLNKNNQPVNLLVLKL